MIEINIESTAKDVEEKYQQYLDDLPDAVKDGLDESAEVTVYMMKAEHFPNYDTGALTSSIEEEETGEYSRSIGPRLDEDYPLFLEKGTRRHPIEGNPYLFWPGADHPVRRVEHPGTKPYPYVEPTYENMKKEYPLIMVDNVTQVFK